MADPLTSRTQSDTKRNIANRDKDTVRVKNYRKCKDRQLREATGNIDKNNNNDNCDTQVT